MTPWKTRLPLRTRSALILLVAASALSACAWAPPQVDPVARQPVTTPGDYSKPVSPVLQTAQTLLGIPYKYGGQAPDTGFDCSGLVYYAHRVHGIEVPRTARGLHRAATPVDQDQLSPGDLLFFRTRGRQVSHVGFYVAPGRFLHAPSTGKTVTLADYRDTYWRTRFAGAGRIRH